MKVNPNDTVFYVYVYLDPRKFGQYIYGKYEFEYEPFYVGKGCNGRLTSHLNGNIVNKYFNNKIKKIQKICGHNPYIFLYKEHLNELAAFNLEVSMILTIGRNDLKKGPLCNYTNGGEGLSGKIVSKQTRKKMSTNHVNNMSFEVKRNISESSKGRKLTNNTKRKIGEIHKGMKHTEESKKKMSDAHKGQIPWNKGKEHSDKTREKIRESNKGLKVSEETKRKISESNKNPSPETRKKIGDASRNRIISSETRKKMSESAKRRYISKEIELK